ncbi:copper resistance protein B [Sandarakinorhabdus sp.]|uniref:copper resistance protein B n=1 Tax=Sandarakinorhabdus sp. TaxID=1916663 RepID=UPI00286E43F0|nr:copper resistance protein B [Sandarakinorhabdus sp.]
MMRMVLLAGLLWASPAWSQTAAMPDMAKHHGGQTYSFATAEVDYTRFDGSGVVNWDAEGWIGSDMNKFWWRTEGETDGPRLEQVEFQALYSRNVATFFDLQGGLRYDIEPDRRGYAVIGIQGLAPYFFETQLHAFIGFKGDVLVRLRQSFDIRMTNRLVLEPMLETDLYLTDVPERRIASGFSIIEAGVMARYEVTRKVAPYVSVMFERRLGGSARLAAAAGENVGGWSLRGGVRFWFN